MNHPAVFDTAVGLAAAWPVDFAQVFEAHPGLLAFAGDYGIALFAPIPEVPKAYDSHFAVIPEGRGEWCREAAREVLYRMFWEHEAALLLFRCPQGNLAASAGAKMLGGRFYLETEPRFPSLTGPVPFNVYYLTRKRWLEVTGRSN